MKAATTAYVEPFVLTRSRVADYLELTKPRVAVLVLFTVAAGALLAARGTPDLWVLVHVLCGTALVAAGASALNQFIERHSDALMRRTENRPLPSGRLQPLEVLVFGSLLGIAGTVYLALFVRQPLAALVAGATFLSYVFLYTPLKRKTTLNTLVGAVPGALPPVIGWTAVRGSIDAEVVVLFLIVFLWQVPHFLAIAWIYREDYARAGLHMLPTLEHAGGITGRQMLSYCLALIPVSLMPAALNVAGPLYVAGALGLGVLFLGAIVGFVRTHSVGRARRVLRASLVYLPVLLTLLLVDGALRLFPVRP
ncbi:MAG TPA: heme o synthase [Gemmataceae bacterium]|nr:heme o synthase [Gemmataceae bacterium]